MSCTACGFENPAGFKFCGRCASPLAPASACVRCGFENPPGFQFCGECASPLTTAPADSSPAREPRAYTPKHLADKILASKSALEGERKQVTVLFADVKSSMELAERVDAEEWHAILDRFFAILADGVHRFEGTVNQYTGDGIMALFGAPIAHEDHAQRACYTALHLREELRRYAQELRRARGLDFAARIGLNSGEVVVGKIGDDLRMDYTAQGHVVGIAQRMEALAEGGRVYLSRDTAALVRGYFALEDLGEFLVKGAAEPLQVFSLEGIGALRTRLDLSRSRGLSRFVGRADETATLEAALARAQAGDGQVVGIVAEPGVGKSRLCFELAERSRARGVGVREARCVSHGGRVPLLPVLELLRGVFEISDAEAGNSARIKIAGAVLLADRALEAALPVLFELLGVEAGEPRGGPALAPEEKQRRILAVVRRLMEARSALGQTSVILFEDLHWIDPASDAFLEGLVEAAAATRTLLVLNFRPEYRARWMSKSSYQQIALHPLGPDATRELLRDLLGADVSLTGLAERIALRTSGNPFFAEEVVTSLAESGTLAGAKGAYRLAAPIDALEIPQTVQAVLAARIDRLGEREKHVLRAASVIGASIAEPLLRAVANVPDTELGESLRALVAAELLHETALYPEAEYGFKHPLTQEVAYRSQLGERRRALHGAVARELEQRVGERPGERAALLAHHFDEAGEALEAARWHRQAAGFAGASLVQRADHWRRVLALVRELPESPECDALGRDAGLQLLTSGARVGAPAEEMAAVFAEAREYARRAGDELAEAELHATHAWQRMLSEAASFDEAGSELEAACERIERGGDIELRILALYYLYTRYLLSSHFREGLEVVERALGLARNAGELSFVRFPDGAEGQLLSSKAVCLQFLGRLPEARRVMADLAAAVERTGSALGRLFLHQLSAMIGVSSGDAVEALRHASLMLELVAEQGLLAGSAHALMGQAHLLAGNLDSAASCCERALRLASLMSGQSLICLAEIELRRGDFDAALARLSEPRGGLAMRSAQCLAALAILRRDGAAARPAVEQRLAEAEALIARNGGSNIAPQLHAARAELARACGDAAGFERQRSEALRLCAEMEAPLLAQAIERELAALPEPGASL